MPNFSTRQLVAKPRVESILAYYQPPLCGVPEPPPPNPGKEIVVLATACFQGIDPRAYDAHRVLVAQMAVDYQNNCWIIPVHERMPFPDACLYSIGAMLNMEKAVGRKADWFFWLEDDICVPKDTVRRLRRIADTKDRPFVAAIGYDRNPPFPPAVWDWKDETLVQWKEAPSSGVYPVGATGLAAALIHRSLFDRISEPYFAAGSPVLSYGSPTNQIMRGIKPDAWWSCRLREQGIPSYVDASIEVTHLGARLPVNRETAQFFRTMPGFERENFERTTRGHPQARADSVQGDTGPVPPSVRPSAPQGMDGRYVTGDGTGPPVSAGTPGGLGMPQITTASRTELPGGVCVDESPGLWSNWNPFAGEADT